MHINKRYLRKCFIDILMSEDKEELAIYHFKCNLFVGFIVISIVTSWTTRAGAQARNCKQGP